MKVMLVVTTATEAEGLYQTFRELIEQEGIEVVCVDTGSLAHERGTESPGDAMRRLMVPSIPLTSVYDVVSKEMPDIIVAGSDQEYLRRSFLLAADGMGIQSLLLCMGVLSDAKNTVSVASRRTFYRLRHNAPNIIKKYLILLGTVIRLRWSGARIVRMILRDIKIAFTVDIAIGTFGKRKVAVTSQLGKIEMQRRTDAGLVHIVRPLERDSGRTPDLQVIRDMLGLRHERVILLLTSAMVEHGHWTTARRELFMSTVIDSITPLLGNNVKMVVKIHPVEKMTDYQRWATPDIKVCHSISLEGVIGISDAVLATGSSTTVIDAGRLGKPVIHLNLFGDKVAIEYGRMGLAVDVTTPWKLGNVTKALLYDERTRAIIIGGTTDFFQDEKGAESLASLIVRLTE